jgi:hypothetical protein
LRQSYEILEGIDISLISVLVRDLEFVKPRPERVASFTHCTVSSMTSPLKLAASKSPSQENHEYVVVGLAIAKISTDLPLFGFLSE